MNAGQQVRQLGEANILSLIFKYSTPAILSTVVNAAYNLIDRIFVGRACGEEGLAAVTVCFSPTLFFLAFGMTIGHGSATMVSIMLGAKNKEAAERYLGQAFFLFVLLAAVIAAIVLPNMNGFLRLFGATERLLPLASEYYTVVIAGLIFEKISFGINNLIRAEGRPIFSMSIILMCGVINTLLDYIFLFKFGMGVAGAAYATIIAQAFGAATVFYFYFFSGKNFLMLKIRNLLPRKSTLKAMLAAGSPSFVIQSLAAFSTALFILQARTFGAEQAIAIIGVSSATTMMLFLPVVGLSMGAQPIFGFNWGARNLERVKDALLKLLVVATVFCCVSFALTEIFSENICELFLGTNSKLVPDATGALRILVAMFPFIGVNIVASGYFQATKRPKFSILVTTLRQLIFLAPLLLFLPTKMGIRGVWYSFPAADVAAFLLTIFFIYREIKKLNAHQKAKDI